MADSVMTIFSGGMRFNKFSVVSSVVSKVRKLRLLIPNILVLSFKAASSSFASCTSTNTPMPSSCAQASSSAINP